MTPQLAFAGAVLLGMLTGSSAAVECSSPQADCVGSTENTERISKDYGRFYFMNNCKHPIKVALKWTSPDGSKVNGWWSIDSESEIYFSMDGVPIQLVNDTIYYYAESTSRRDYRDWKGEHDVRFGNADLPMRRREVEPDRDGNRSFAISCRD